MNPSCECGPERTGDAIAEEAARLIATLIGSIMEDTSVMAVGLGAKAGTELSHRAADVESAVEEPGLLTRALVVAARRAGHQTIAMKEE